MSNEWPDQNISKQSTQNAKTSSIFPCAVVLIGLTSVPVAVLVAAAEALT